MYADVEKLFNTGKHLGQGRQSIDLGYRARRPACSGLNLESCRVTLKGVGG
jgi:hypothetical protein